MEAKDQRTVTEKMVSPQQVWETLEAGQREIVLQTILRICQEILERMGKEEPNEPVPDR